jgi:hypothetical protein
VENVINMRTLQLTTPNGELIDISCTSIVYVDRAAGTRRWQRTGSPRFECR